MLLLHQSVAFYNDTRPRFLRQQDTAFQPNQVKRSSDVARSTGCSPSPKSRIRQDRHLAYGKPVELSVAGTSGKIQTQKQAHPSLAFKHYQTRTPLRRPERGIKSLLSLLVPLEDRSRSNVHAAKPSVNRGDRLELQQDGPVAATGCSVSPPKETHLAGAATHHPKKIVPWKLVRLGP